MLKSLKNSTFCNTFATRKTDNNEEIIILKLTNSATRKQISTGIKVKKGYFIKDSQRVKSGIKDSLSINESLNEIEKLILEIKLKRGSIDDVERKLKCYSISLKDYISKIQQSFIDNKKVGNARVYKNLINKIESDIIMKDISNDYINKFRLTLKDLAPNSQLHYLKTLNAVLNKAYNDKLIPEPIKIKLFTPEKTKQSAYLNKSDMDKLKETELTGKSEYYRNLFLLQYYCNGINFKDIAELTEDNITDDAIIYKRAKTHKEIIIPLNDRIIYLLEWFKQFTLLNNRLLPISEKEYKETPDYYDYIDRRLTAYNKGLKKLSEKLSIKPITSNISRHTVAMTLRNNDVPIEMISQVLGHSNTDITTHYLEAFSNDKIRQVTSCL